MQQPAAVPRDYTYDQGFSAERSRLAGIESRWDPGSQALIDVLGSTDGRRCLEVGAGGDAPVQWMAGRSASAEGLATATKMSPSVQDQNRINAPFFSCDARRAEPI
jgi:hypothetical protein